MRTTISSPLPIFKSDAQFRLLGELFTVPGLEVMITELSRRLELPDATVSREVARLLESELLVGRRDGRRHLVSANHDHPMAADLASLLLKAYGPRRMITEALRTLEGVERAFVFGSFAARSSGVDGPAPRDVDVMVIGTSDVVDVWDLTARLSSDLGIEVNATIRTPEEWADDTSGFADQVRSSPQIELDVP